MIVSFWSPVVGRAKTTSSMLALAVSAGIADIPTKTFITSTQVRDKTLINSLKGMRGVEIASSSDLSRGIVDLEIQSNIGTISLPTLERNTDFILRDRLDFLPVARASSEESLGRVFERALEAIRKYPLAMFDFGSDLNNPSFSVIKEKSDLIVVCLPQEKSIIEEFAESRDSYLEGKRFMVCIGGFDRSSSMGLKKIASILRLKVSDLISVPYSTGYLDFYNSNDVVEYILRSVASKKRFLEFSEDKFFADTVKESAKRLLRKANVVFSGGAGS